MGSKVEDVRDEILKLTDKASAVVFLAGVVVFMLIGSIHVLNLYKHNSAMEVGMSENNNKDVKNGLVKKGQLRGNIKNVPCRRG